ncbi:MAG: hypothetical protein Q8N55_04485 [bacterium]|nr:hypothetical protein [bacterium]
MGTILKRIWNKLFGKSKHHWDVTFQVLNPEKVKVDYDNSVGGLSEFTLQNDKPKGVGFFYGKDKEYIIGASYDKRLTNSKDIQAFLERYGLRVKILEEKPFKRFAGVEYI